MKEFFAEYNISQYSVKSQFKASLVERFNRTLKTKMWQYFTHMRTKRWIDVLSQLVKGYNNSYHRSIRMTPNQVNDSNEMWIWLLNEEADEKIPKVKKHVKVGDHVRLSKAKNVFEKGYLPSWTTEIFTVSKILNTKPVQVKVKDSIVEEIQGSFYMQEIQQVDMPEDFEIEKIISRKRVGGQMKYLVKWLGYPKSANSWVTAADIRQL
jgi:hypothetical protein